MKRLLLLLCLCCVCLNTGCSIQKDTITIGGGSVPAKPGTLIVDSIPQQANVEIDGKAYGEKTPYPFRLSVGQHVIKLSMAGYETDSFVSSITDGANITVTRTLKQIVVPPTQGILNVETIPTEASIEIDGYPISTSPFSGAFEKGRHSVKLTKPGFKEEKFDIQISAETTTQVKKTLTDNKVPDITLILRSYSNLKGTVSLNANASDEAGISKVQFMIDSEVLGDSTGPIFTLPWDTTKVTPGTHVVQAIAFDNNGLTSFTARDVTVYDQGNHPESPSFNFNRGWDPMNSSVLVLSVPYNSDIKQVSFYYINYPWAPTLITTDSAPPFEYAFDTTSLRGKVIVFEAVAQDAQGNQSSKCFSISIP